MNDAIHPNAALMRGFAIDLLSAHDLGAAERIMAPGYRLDTGGHALVGRDASYGPAIAAQLAIFPGLGVTVHELVLGERAAALRFTESGASRRQGGRVAAWGGVALFRIDDERLQSCWAEEDYFGRKRQFDAGVCDAIEAPHPAPWDSVPEAEDGTAEAVARAWLQRPDVLGSGGPAALDIVATRINALFATVRRAAFHVDCEAIYTGGFADVGAADRGIPVVLRVAGLLDVVDGEVAGVRSVADWLGLHKALRAIAR